MKIFWKGFSLLDAGNCILDSWEEVEISTLAGMWKQFIPALMDDLEELKTLVKEVPRGEMETARELELEVEPEDETEILQSQDEICTDDFLLMDEQRQ